MTGQGYPPGQPSEVVVSKGPNCATQKPGLGTVGITFQAGLTIDSNLPASSEISRGTVNKRRAVRLRNGVGGSGDCDVVMEVKPDSRAILVATLSKGDTDQACQIVNDLGTKIDPLLP